MAEQDNGGPLGWLDKLARNPLVRAGANLLQFTPAAPVAAPIAQGLNVYNAVVPPDAWGRGQGATSQSATGFNPMGSVGSQPYGPLNVSATGVNLPLPTAPRPGGAGWTPTGQPLDLTQQQQPVPFYRRPEFIQQAAAIGMNTFFPNRAEDRRQEQLGRFSEAADVALSETQRQMLGQPSAASAAIAERSRRDLNAQLGAIATRSSQLNQPPGYAAPLQAQAAIAEADRRTLLEGQLAIGATQQQVALLRAADQLLGPQTELSETATAERQNALDLILSLFTTPDELLDEIDQELKIYLVNQFRQLNAGVA